MDSASPWAMPGRNQEGWEASLQVAACFFCALVHRRPLLHDAYQGKQGLRWSLCACYGFKLVGSEQEGITRMSKIGFPISFIAYSLQMTYQFLLLYARISSKLYNYWFNTNDASDICSDTLCCTTYIFYYASCLTLCSPHILLRLIIGSVQLLPFWTLFSFWPCLYYLILTNPKHRSFLQMMRDPRY